ncbi:MAG TPA: type III polyketide synthase [Mycobacteriales bacterium]|nr:type III polyketide synthase [Mycobacteriales bacterium]
MTLAVVAGHGHALPPKIEHAALWSEFFAAHYNGNPTAERVWRTAGIRTRHAVVDPRAEDVTSWSTGARMQRFAVEAMPLGKAAVAGALADAGVDADDVGMFAVASCTGYATPGLDILLARDLGMADDVQRLHIGHMGCYAALPGLGAVADYVCARGRPAVLLCLELTSLHIQPATDNVQQMVAHALFADASAAVVLKPPGATHGGRPDLEVVDVVARTDTSAVDQMTWDITDLGFRMGLSPKVPDVLARHVGNVVGDLLARNGLGVGDVSGWAIHPGGRRIVEVVAEQLGLAAEAVEPSYAVLSEVGNCSSATVLLVLERVLANTRLEPGSPIVMMAFGPGLTLYAALLRAGGAPPPA